MNARLKVVFAMLIWGSLGLFVKFIDLPSSLIACVRGFIGGIFLLLFFLLRKNHFSKQALLQNILPLLLSGVALGANWIFLFEAYKYTSIANATLSYYLAPTIITIASIFILKEKLTVFKVVCVITALIGMGFVTGVFSGAASIPTDRIGIQFGIAAAASYASVTIINKFLQGISPMESTICQLLIAAGVLLPYVLLTEDVASLAIEGSIAWLLIVMGIVHTGIAFYLYFSSIPQLSAQSIAVLSYIDPLTAIVLAALILREPVSGAQIIGAALILGSVFINDRLESIKTKA